MIKTIDKTIDVGIIYNAFEPTKIDHSKLQWRKNVTLGSVLADLPTDCDWKVALNGFPIDLEKEHKKRLKKNDKLILVVVPHGGGSGGSGKTILRAAAMIAIAVAVTALLPGVGDAFLGGTMTAGLHAGIIAAVTIGGGMLVNALIPATTSTDTVNYGYDGAKNTAKPGVAIPVVYGTYRVAGNYIDNFTRQIGNDQYLYGRTVLCDGQATGVANPLINDQTISNYYYLEIGYGHGYNDYILYDGINANPSTDANFADPSFSGINPYFDQNITQVTRGQLLPGSSTSDWLQYTTSAEVDQFTLDLEFTRGLISYGDTGIKHDSTCNLDAQYSPHGANNWQNIGSSQLIKYTGAMVGTTPATDKLAVTVEPTLTGDGFSVPYTYEIQYKLASSSTWTTFKTVTSTSTSRAYILNGGAYINWSTLTPVESIEYIQQFDTVAYQWAVPLGEYQIQIVGQGSMVDWSYRDSEGGFLTYSYTNQTAQAFREQISSGVLDRGIYDIRYRKTTDEGNNTYVVNELYLVDVAEITNTPIGLTGVTYGWYAVKMTDQFAAIPNVTFEVQGVAVNKYDVHGNVTATEYSSNPAWIVLDMLISEDRGSPGIYSIDYPAFFEWAAWCDEKSLNFNGVFDTISTLWDSCQMVLKVGHANFTRVGSKLSVVVDKPTDPVMLFGPGNIFKDTFKVDYVAIDGRANEFEVSYYDATDFNKQKTLRIIDPTPINAGDLPNTASYTLQGVTDYDQAYNEAWYQLYNNRYIRRTITFDAPIESIGLSIGDIALIQHDIMNWGDAGRVAQGSNPSTVILDKNVTFDDQQWSMLAIFDNLPMGNGTIGAIGGFTVTVNNCTNTSITEADVQRLYVPSTGADVEIIDITYSGSTAYVVVESTTGLTNAACQFVATDAIQERDVVSIAGETTNVINLVTPFDTTPAQYSNYMIGIKTIVKKPYRLKSMNGTGFDARTLTFIEYNENIFLPPGNLLDQPPTAAVVTAIGQVENLRLTYDTRATDANTSVLAYASWTTPQSGVYGGADVYTSTNGGAYVFYQSVLNSTSFSFYVNQGDTIGVKVVAYNTTGSRASVASAPYASITVQSGGAYLVPPSNLEVTLISYLALGLVQATWEAGDSTTDLKYRVQVLNSGTDAWDEYAVTSELNVRVDSLSAGTHQLRVRSEKATAYSIWSTTTFSVGTTTDTIQPGATVGAPSGTVFGNTTVDAFLSDYEEFTSGGGFDTVPPNAPTGLALTSNLSGTASAPYVVITASWNQNTETDLAYYDVEISVNGGGYISYTTTSNTYNWNVAPADVVNVKIRAVDKAGNPSSYSSVVSITAAKDTTPPSPVTNLTAVASYSSIYLKWSNPADTDLKNCYIYYNTVDNFAGAALVTTVNAVPSASGAFSQTGLTAGQTYYYWVIAVDTSGNQSTSVEVSASAGYVIGADITGQLYDAQIASLAASKITGQLTDSQLSAINAAKVQGQLINAQIESVESAKITGEIQAAQIAGIAASQVTGQMTSDQIASVAAAKLTGQVVADQIAQASIDSSKLEAGLSFVQTVTSFPSSGYEGQYISYNNKLYRYTSGQWVGAVAAADLTGQLQAAQIASVAAGQVTGQLTASQIASVNAADIAGQVVSSQIANAAIDSTKIASGLSFVTTISSLSTPGYEGEYASYNGQLVRFSNGQWVGAVAASDINGQIQSAQIAGVAASKITGDLTADQIAGIYATNIVGSIVASQIASINASQIAGTIQAAQIAGVTASQVTGQLTASQISSVNAATLVGQVVASQIASINANQIQGTITAAQIAGVAASQVTGQLTSSQIASVNSAALVGQVVADQIANVYASTMLGQITGTQISDNSITTPKLVAGSITASKISLVSESLFPDPQCIDINWWLNGNASLALAGYTTPGYNGTSSTWLFNSDPNLSQRVGSIGNWQLWDGGFTGSFAQLVAPGVAASASTTYEFSAGVFNASNKPCNFYVQMFDGTANLIGGIFLGPINATDNGNGSPRKWQFTTFLNTKAIRFYWEIPNDGVTFVGFINVGNINVRAASSATMIVDGTITGDKIQANTITGTNIEGGTITGNLIAGNTISAGNIQSGTITSAQIAAGAILASNIAAGAITADNIAANAITASKLVLSPNNLCTDPTFEDNSFWYLPTGWYFETSETGGWVEQLLGISRVAVFGSQAGGASSSQMQSALIPCSSTNQKVSFKFVASNGTSTGFAVGINAFDVNKNYITNATGYYVSANTSGPFETQGTIPPLTCYISFYALPDGNYSMGANQYFVMGNFQAVFAATASMIVDGTITASKIQAGTITGTQISGGTITGNLIAANTISGSNIQAGTIQAAEIAGGTIQGTNIAGGTITGGNIQGETITAFNIVAGTITGDKIQANTITATQIAGNTITGDKVAANTITGTNIQAGTIQAANIQGGTIQGSNIAGGTITGGNIQGQSITAFNIATDTITAAQIASGTITADELAAGSITASKLSISGNNMVADPNFNDSSFWLSRDGVTYGYYTEGGVGNANTMGVARCITLNGNQPRGQYYCHSDFIPAAVANKVVAFSYVVENGSADGFLVGIEFFDQNHVYLAGQGQVAQPFSAPSRVTFQATAPNFTAYINIVMYNTNSSALNGGFPSMGLPTLVIATTGELIVDGSVSATKITAGTITASQIAGSTITGGQIAGNTITGGNILAGTITAANIAAGTIQASNIASGTITGDKIAGNTIVGGNIQGGTITGSNIAGDTITASQIATGTITASEMAAQSITASKLSLIGESLWPDPQCVDLSWWTGSQAYEIVGYTNPAYNGTDFTWKFFPDTGTSGPGRVGSKGFWQLWSNSGTAFTGTTAQVVCPSVTSAANTVYEFSAGIFNGSNNPLNVTAQFFDAGLNYISATYLGAIGAGDGGNPQGAARKWQFTTPAATGHIRMYWEIAGGTAFDGYINVGNINLRAASSATMIVDGTITASKIQASTITGTQIAGGTITGDLIAGNTISAANIQAGSITSSQIAAGTIQAYNIAANSISADKLGVGTNKNMLYGSDGFMPIDYFANWDAGTANPTYSVGRYYGPQWSLPDGSTYYAHQSDANSDSLISFYYHFPTDTNGSWTNHYPVTPGSTYIASAYIDCHRAYSYVGMVWYDSSHNYISEVHGQLISPKNTTAADLFGYDRQTLAATPPSNAAFVMFMIRKGGTIAGQGYTDSYMFWTRPQLEAVAAGVTVPSDWSAYGQTVVNGGSIFANSIQASAIAANSLTANQIAGGTITGGNIAGGTITGTNIQAGTIQASNIAAGTIQASNIASNAITASKVTLTGGNMCPDANFTDDTYWQPTNGWYTENGVNASALGGSRCITLNGSLSQGGYSLHTQSKPLAYGGKTVAFTYKTLNQTGDNFYIGCEFRDNNGNYISTLGAFSYANSGIQTVSLKGIVPFGTAYFNFYCTSQGDGPFNNGYFSWAMPFLIVATSAELIVDGTITSAQIQTGGITADSIAAGTITGDKISSSTSLPASLTIGSTGFNLSSIATAATQGAGANRVPFSNFEAGQSYWNSYVNTANGWQSTGWVWSASPTNVYHGQVFSKLENSNASAGQDFAIHQHNFNDLIHQGFAVTAGERLCVSCGAEGANVSNQYIVIWFHDANGNSISSSVVAQSAGQNFGTVIGGFVTVPAGAVTGYFEFHAIAAGNGYASLVVTHPSVTSATSTQTVFPTFTPGPTPDFGAAINANTTLITPGKIQLAGSTTLTNWLYGGDNTLINGGAIAANTIQANKVTIGNRNLNFIDLNFQTSTDGRTISWGSGFVQYYDDNMNYQQLAINPGSAYYSDSQYYYVYWTQGSNYLGITTTSPVANVNAVTVCTWQNGQRFFTANYGATIIDGTRITTGTITATQIATGTISADKMAVGSLDAISAIIGTLRTATSGARMEISDNVIKVFDSNNVLRVQIGNLSI